MSAFAWPERTVVHVDGHEIEVRPGVHTVCVQVPVGAGCVNDTWEDRPSWRAEYQDRVAWGDTPEQAARAVLIR